MEGFASCVDYQRYIDEIPDEEFDRIIYTNNVCDTEGDTYSAMSYTFYNHDLGEYGYYSVDGSWNVIDASSHQESAVV